MSLNLKAQHKLRTMLTKESADSDTSPEYLPQGYSLVAAYVVNSTAKFSRPDMCGHLYCSFINESSVRC